MLFPTWAWENLQKQTFGKFGGKGKPDSIFRQASQELMGKKQSGYKRTLRQVMMDDNG